MPSPRKAKESFPWQWASNSFKFLTHPISVFVLMQIVWVALTILWVIWFISQNEVIGELTKAMGARDIDPTLGIFTLIIGCILLAIIMLGTILLFVFTQKQTSLVRQQKTFVSSVTHELRSPLASLQLSFETLQSGQLPEPIAKKLMGMVQTDIDRLVRLVDRILISASLDRGIHDLKNNNECFNLYDLIIEIKEHTRFLDVELDQRFELDCDQNMEIVGSRLAYSMVIGNLLENAIKYSPKESIIKVHTSSHKNSILIAVEDHGYGISRKDLKKIFKLFHRSSLATSKAIHGTGIGLYLVKSTVKLLDGKVWAESQGTGRGSTFFISIPSG
ncbi:MAG: hypothetical protein CMP10_10860 [Zetaproteobacteria bacterium]|nr:hypothetical protein [Pseudobdellovibrionaceae bacterium]